MSFVWFVIASLLEIGGCFAFWAYFRLHKSPAWMALGVLSLILFAMALTRVDSSNAGRAYAAYGSIYICSALIWMWLVEKNRPDHWDIGGAAICLVGSAVVLFGKHAIRS